MGQLPGIRWTIIVAFAGLLVGMGLAWLLAKMRGSEADDSRLSQAVGGGLGAALGVVLVPWLPIGPRVGLAILVFAVYTYIIWDTVPRSELVMAEVEYTAQTFWTRANDVSPLLAWVCLGGIVLLVCAASVMLVLLVLQAW